MQSLIVVFNGPWHNGQLFCGPNDGGRIDFDRLEAGIAQHRKTPNSQILLVGDANHGKDLETFFRYGLSIGVNLIHRYDPRANTYSDVLSAIEFLKANLELYNKVFLVSHVWHLERVATMFTSEIVKHLPVVRFDTYDVPVISGPEPTREMLIGEQKGIKAYLDGSYGQHKYDDHVGKPMYEVDQIEKEARVQQALDAHSAAFHSES